MKTYRLECNDLTSYSPEARFQEGTIPSQSHSAEAVSPSQLSWMVRDIEEDLARMEGTGKKEKGKGGGASELHGGVLNGKTQDKSLQRSQVEV